MATLRTWFGAEIHRDADAQRKADIAAMDNDPRYEATLYLIEATHHETNAEWCRLAKSSPYRYDLKDIRTVEWVQTNPGYWTEVGKLAGHPVVVNLHWAHLNGALVCFWESTSRVVDYDMIEKWLDKKFPNVVVKTNATNIHLALNEIDRRRA